MFLNSVICDEKEAAEKVAHEPIFDAHEFHC